LPPQQGFILASIGSFTGLNYRDQASIHLRYQLFGRPSFPALSTRIDPSAVNQSDSPNRTARHSNPIVLLNPNRRLQKGVFRSKVRQGSLQLFGIPAQLHSAQQPPTPSQ